MCPGARDVAVCDLPGDEARFEDSSGGPTLVGGQLALCTDDGTLGCPSGSDDDAEVRCVFDPSL